MALAWVFPALLVATSPPFMKARRPQKDTRDALAEVNKTLRGFLEKNKQTPSDLNVLRAYAKAERKPFTAYDAYGARLDYVRLGEERYILRSFGEDGVQNSLDSAPDLGIVHWGVRARTGLNYRYTSAPQLDIFPAVLLEGADSPNRQWLARLFIDPATRDRRLVVRHKSKSDLFMVAQHAGVEEFLWMPSGYQVVFTATGDHRYRDGIFLWDLVEDRLTNLLDLTSGDLAGTLSPTGRPAKLALSLAGVSVGGPTVYAYFADRRDVPIDPAVFFSKARLLTFVVPEKKGASMRHVPTANADVTPGTPPFTRLLDLTTHVHGEKQLATGGLKVQRTWLRLKLQGDMEKVLLAWHGFSEHQAGSPLFPYCLWFLSSIYSESFSVLASGQSRDADVLRTYGTEVARALVNYPLTPSYLRGLALFTYENLMEGNPLPYRFAHLTTQASSAAADAPKPTPAQPFLPPTGAAKWIPPPQKGGGPPVTTIDSPSPVAPSPTATPKSVASPTQTSTPKPVVTAPPAATPAPTTTAPKPKESP